MTSPPDAKSRPRRWLRRLAVAAAAGLVCLTALLLALPWIVSLPISQRLLASQAARIMAPGSVRFDRVAVSWTQPTRIEGLVLVDAQGDEIVTSPRAYWSWSLRELLLTRPVEMTLTLEHAAVDIQRDASGTIDLLETLKPVIQDQPEHTLLIRLPDGNLRFRAEGLNEPFLAEPAEIELDLNAYPAPIAWRMRLHRLVEGTEPGRVDIRGSMSRRRRSDGQPEELGVAIVADRWPWAFSGDRFHASGGLTGTIDVADRAETLKLQGDVRILNLLAAGEQLSGDQLKLETVGTSWEAVRANHVWTVTRLDVTAEPGTIKAAGTYPPAGDQGARLTANLDLAALARQLPRTFRLHQNLQLRKGAIELEAEVRGVAGEDAQTVSARARLSELSAMHGDRSLVFRDPATLEAKLRRRSDNLTLEQLEVKTPFLTATGQGDLDRGIDVSAVVDLDAGSRRLRDWVDLGTIELAGQGKVDARYQRIVSRFEASARAEFRGLDLKGLPIVERLQRDHVTSTLKVSGSASASGLPDVLHDLVLQTNGDAESLALTASRDLAAGTAEALLKAETGLVLAGKRQTAGATVHARWDAQRASLDPISLTLTPVVGPGGDFLPSDPLRWSGKGTYDRGKDELIILIAEPVQGSRSPAISPSEIRASGLAARNALRLDLSLAGSLAGLIPPDETGRTPFDGRLDGLMQARQGADGWDLGARVRVRELVSVDREGARQLLAADAGASVRGKLAATLERLELSELALATPYGAVDGSGVVSDLRGSPHFDLRGLVSPDWKALTELLTRNVEPNASITGSPRPWRLSGTLAKLGTSEWMSTVNGELGVGLEQVDVFGMRLGQTIVTVRAREGKILIDPIDGTLNSGRLHLEPEVVEDKKGGAWLHLGPTSGLLDAVVNDEVSHRVLSFAAPVLDQATRVRGRVSLALSDAYIPLGQGPDLQARIDGDVLFDAVEFMPGPLADQILGVFRQERRPLLVLRDPVSVRIVGRRVYQEGLIIPLGNVAVIGLEGWVDFDQNLDLVASFAVVPPRQNIPVLSDLLASTQLQVPITGTFKKPRLNGDAIKDRFKEMGTNVLDTLIGVGANGLNRILRGRPGAAPPRGDFFPPFRRPGDDEPAPLPPAPGLDGPLIDSRTAPKDRDAHPAAGARPQTGEGHPSDNPDDALGGPPSHPGQLTPEQRQSVREERRQRRLDKRAERRLRRGLVP